MNIKELTYLLQNPDQVKKTQVHTLDKLTREFPYFQPIRALKLKGLKEQESFKYNQELKTTAVYTADRGVLFDFITSNLFTKKESHSETFQKQKTDIEVVDAQEIKTLPRMSMDDAVTMKMKEAEDVLDPELFATRQEESIFRHVTISESLNKQSKENEEKNETDLSEETDIAGEDKSASVLQIDKPFEFDKKETHSFSEWLKLTSLQPIDRSKDHSEETPEETKDAIEKEKPSSQKNKFDLIDQFIANNPKIPRGSKSVTTGNLAQKSQAAEEELMTETLARVYVAQKNYKKAIQAYKILILKNPEKSGFFADQIRAIKKLKENK